MRAHLYRLGMYMFGPMLFACSTGRWNDRDWMNAISNWYVVDDFGNAVLVDHSLWRERSVPYDE